MFNYAREQCHCRWMGTGERTEQKEDGTIRIACSTHLICEVVSPSYDFYFFASSTILPAVPLAMDVLAC